MPPKTGGVTKPQRASRRKIALACDVCREKKTRCDGVKPTCGPCLRRPHGARGCVYTMDNARTASQDEYMRALHLRIQELEDACARAGVSLSATEGSSSGVSLLAEQPQHERQSPASSRELQGGQGSIDHANSVLHGVQPTATVPETIHNHGTGEVDTFDDDPRSASPHFESPGHVTGMGQISAPDGCLRTPAPVPAKEYYGSSSTASLMRFARMTLRPHSSGPIGADSQGTPNYEFQESANTCYRPDDYTLPPRSVADQLLEYYWDRVACIYPFFDRSNFELAYQNLWRSEKEPMNQLSKLNIGLGGQFDSGPRSIVFHAALNAMFALACHFAEIPIQERESTAHSFFLRSKRFIGLDILEHNTIGVVQTLLLTALYLQSTPYPSRCWNAIGLACRIAQGLGLHKNDSRFPCTSLEGDVRRRTWHGCVMLDILVSMTHGRPSMTSHLAFLPLPRSLDASVSPETEATRSEMSFYVASIQLHQILGKILSDVYNTWNSQSEEDPTPSNLPKDFNVDNVIELEKQLHVYKSTLPSYLDWTVPRSTYGGTEPSPTLERQRNVLHVRYCHIRLLLYRRIFTQCYSETASHSAQGDGSEPGRVPLTQNTDNTLYSCIADKCAETCVMTAVDLIQAVYDTCWTTFTGAWWYNGFYTTTAALVLVMSYSMPSLLRSIGASLIQESWAKCERILGDMATYSHSARTSLHFLQTTFNQVASRCQPSPEPSVNAADGTSRVVAESYALTIHRDVNLPDSEEVPENSLTSNLCSYSADNNLSAENLGLFSWVDVPDLPPWLGSGEFWSGDPSH
ncbi:uncharacterized protein BO95DRAFT_512878 [Aspergillus brunneoviolaceus CBS 621.78]|uniref:Uncharacterized protein n=1 Tax=Aspergillus brunneoviolaceus CBS 621.78 TaxID=1450534 RepID=A0ACD1GEH9_9EURO|nr:hypothetical protein BO95DRAFT_512878 [Aspergillus brunneoviolaceus CBS 621.78]RAH47699.1 hypothetical protein BO95DRAFT_512878 [Aspergillus brunneoviolaceus CBS 621.78]